MFKPNFIGSPKSARPSKFLLQITCNTSNDAVNISSQQTAMKTALRQGGAADLNVYSVG